MEKAINILTAVVRNASLGDNTAQAMLYEQFSQRMFSICVRMTGSRSDAQDLLQESFITAFQQLASLRDKSVFEGWLRKIVVNHCIAYSKKIVHWNRLEDDSYTVSDIDDADWIQNVDFDQVHREIRSLPDGCREVFNLFVIEDYAHKEIAEVLGISESTSKSQYHRARQLLRERLKKQLSKHG